MIKVPKIFKMIGEEYIYGGHTAGVAGVCIAVVSMLILGLRFQWDILIVVYLILYVVYAYNRLKDFRSDMLTNAPRTLYLQKYISLLPLIIIGCVAVIFGLLLNAQNTNSIFFVLFMIVGSLLYSLCFKKLTKQIVAFKSIYVAFFWSSVVMLIAIHYNLSFNLAIFLLILFVFLRFLVNTIFFDIKDIISDKKEGLKTLPVVMGERGVIIFLHCMNVVAFFPIVAGVWLGVLPGVSLSLGAVSLYVAYYMILASKGKSNMFVLSYIIADSEPVFWCLLMIIFNIL